GETLRSRKVAVKRLRLLLNVHQPSLVITRPVRRSRHESSARGRRVIRAIRGEAERKLVRFVVVKRSVLRDFFSQQGCRNKHDVETWISNRLPQLQWKLPKARKLWNPEEYLFVAFDAIATAVAFTNGAYPMTPPEPH